MAPRKMVGKVEYKENLAGNIWLVRICFDEEVGYIPGQYASIKVSEDGMRRSYSVASLPGGKSIDLLVDVSPMGVGSKFILSLKIGDAVEVLGFLGKFTVDSMLLLDAKQLLFVATGTGIAPFKPMIEDLLYKKHFMGEVRLIWGMRFEDDLYWLKELDNINRDFDNFKIDVVLSKPGPDWPGFKGHVGVVIDRLQQNWENNLNYLCGSPEMINETDKKLKEKGVPETKIFYEKFF